MDNHTVFFCVADTVSLPFCQKTFITKHEPAYQSGNDDTQMDPDKTSRFEKDAEYHEQNHKVMKRQKEFIFHCQGIFSVYNSYISSSVEYSHECNDSKYIIHYYLMEKNPTGSARCLKPSSRSDASPPPALVSRPPLPPREPSPSRASPP